MTNFTHLHVHTEYSILDGMSKISKLVDKAIACKMPAIAITDHGNMFGVKEFLDYIKKIKSDKNADENVKTFKPIVGVEAYCARRTLHDKDNTLKSRNPESGKEQIVDRSGYHLVLLAKNKRGYENLCKLVSISWIDGEYYSPRIDKNILQQYSEGLIVCSACLGGEIPQHIIRGDLAAAEESIMWFKNLFGDDYYIELQRHKTDKHNAETSVYERQKSVNVELLKLAEKCGVKVIATNDVHFVDEDDADAHERLVCLSTNAYVSDENRLRYTKQEWLKSAEEMSDAFSDVPQALENTQEIVDKIEIFDIDNSPQMPIFDIPEAFGTLESYKEKYTHADLIKEFGGEEKIEALGGFEKVYRIKLEADYLREITMKGVEYRYKENQTAELLERVDFELDVMKQMGFPGYFLIVQDFIQAARDMGVSVGPGRGSAAGSVVAYCLRITDIDPLKYDLLFERFLNPDRISLPDIDIDFDDEGRGKVLRWVTEKYGKERVAHIITYGTMATKMSIKDVARVQQLPLEQADRLTKLIPDRFPEGKDGKAPKVNIKNCVELVPELKEAYNSNNEEIASVLHYAQKLEGTVRQTGVHACGVIIGADDLTNLAPLSTAKDKETGENMIVTQYEGSVVENIGLIKMDFLGLKTLSIIREALSNIKKSKGIDLDIDTIAIDDKKTYQLFSDGATVGTFQFESAGMQKYLKELKPTQFEDLIAMNALYRPGPMQYIPSFIARKHGKEKIEYDFPIMEKRLKETYGITVYQEQVMLLSRDIAGFTRGQSDELRKAMGKKLVDKMAMLKEKFLEGAEKNGFGPTEKLEKVWNDWAEFAKYAFNKSHATCYSWIAYQTAYLKANFPAEYMAAVLTNNQSDIKEVSKFMDDCKQLGINVLPPSVNESDTTFTVNRNGDIRFGLVAVKGVGAAAVESIVNVRNESPFVDIFDFVGRVNLTAVNRKTMESLVLAGAFDDFTEIRRSQFFEKNEKGECFLDVLMRHGTLVQNDKAGGTLSLFGDSHKVAVEKPKIPFCEDWSAMEILAKEKELIGIYLSSHPLDPYKFDIKTFCNVDVASLSDLQQYKSKKICFAGMITKSEERFSKTGKPYGRVMIEDYSGAYEFVLFGDEWTSNKNMFAKNYFLLVRAMVVERPQFKSKDSTTQQEQRPIEYKLKFDKILLLQDVRNELVNAIEIALPLEKIDIDFTKKLTRNLAKNKGDKKVIFTIIDAENKIRIEQSSRKYHVKINNELLNYLDAEPLKYKIKQAF